MASYNLGTARGQIEIVYDSNGTARARADVASLKEAVDEISRNVAEIHVQDADAQRRIDGVLRDLQELNRQRADPTVNLSDADARLELERIRGEIQRLDADNANPGVNINIDDRSLAQLRGVEQSLDALNRLTADPRVNIDTQLANARILETRRQMEALSRQRATARVNVEVRGQDQVDSLITKLAKFRIGLIGLVASVIPAAIPVLGSLTVALGGIAAAVVPAVAGIGLVAGAWKSMSKEILASSAVNQQLTGLKASWKSLSESIKPQLIDATAAGFEGVHKVLGILQPVMTAAGDAVRQLALQFDSWAGSSVVRSFVDFLGRQAGPAIQTFGNLALKVITGLMGILQAFEPIIKPVEDALTSFGNSFATWGQGLQYNQGFKNFLDYVRTNTPLVIRTLKDLWDGLKNLLIALAPLGPPILQFIDALAKLISTVAQSPITRGLLDLLGQSISGLAKFLSSDWGKLTLIAIGIRAIVAAVTSNPWVVTLGAAIIAFGWLYDHDDKLAIGLLAVAAAMWAVNAAGYGLVGVPIIAALAAIGVAIYEVTQHWEGFQRGFDNAFNAVKRAIFAAGAWISDHLGPNSTFGDVLRFKWLGPALDGVGHAIGRFFGMVGENFSNLGNSFSGFGKILGDHFMKGLRGIGGAISGVAGWFWGILTQNFGQLGSFFSRIGHDAVDGLLSGLNSLWGAISGWASGIYHSIVDGLKQLLGIASPSTVMMQIGMDIVQGLINGLQSLLGGIASIIGSIGSTISTAFLTLFGGLTNALMTAGSAIGGFFIGLPGQIASLTATAGTWLLNTGYSVMSGLMSGMSTAWGVVAGFLAGLPARIQGWLVNAGSWLIGHGSAAISGLRNGMASAQGFIAGFLGGLPGRIQGWLSGAFGWLIGHGSAALQGLRNGMSAAQGAVAGFLGGLPGRIRGWLVGAGGWLVSHGSAAMSGLRNGMSSAYGAVSGFVGSIPGRIRGALGGLGGLLVGAGESLMNGLGAGIRSAAQGVFNFVSSIAGKIRSLKGPIPYDRKVLIDNGVALMLGLERGLRRQFAAVQDYAASMAPQIADAFGGASMHATVGAAAAGAALASRTPIVNVNTPQVAPGRTFAPVFQYVGPLNEELVNESRRLDDWDAGL